MTSLKQIVEVISSAQHLWLFVDYDGTLAEFAPTPDRVEPKSEVIELLRCWASISQAQVAVISGRPLQQVQNLIPIPGIVLAGTYGVELQLPNGEVVQRVTYDSVRPSVEYLKARWQTLIDHQPGFYIEDKGWAVAIHARDAEAAEADRVLVRARAMTAALALSKTYRVFDERRFFEIAPALAHKGRTVSYLLDRFARPDVLPLYVGDDAKDEEAFEVIKARHGLALLVASEPRPTCADARLPTPHAARRWLAALADRFSRQ
ncbi:MAG: trehalose-phosphatase [Anaerolineae bacterium]